MGLAALRQAIADDFVRVEYIENTTDAYIDTLIKGSNKISIQLKYIFKKNSESTNSGFMFGSRVANNDRQYGIINSYTTQFRFGNNSSLTDYITDTDILVTLDNTEKHYEMKILDSSNNLLHTLTTTNNTFSNNYNLYIFGMNNKGSLIAFSDTTKLYSCKIYDGSTLVRDYIPMYQISTDTYGLWDRVTEEFYVSPNGTKFNGGEQVIADADDNLYYLRNYIVIQNSAKQCSIGLYPNESDYYETKVYLAGSARNYFCGAWSGNNNNAYGARAMNGTLYFEYDDGTIDYKPSGGFTNKTFIYKTLFDKAEQKMQFYIFDANNKQLWTESVDKRSGTSSRVFLLGKLNGSTYGANTNTRMYYFKFWRDQELIRDMIPAQNVESGEYCFFDKINLKAYYSSGSADFTGA